MPFVEPKSPILGRSLLSAIAAAIATRPAAALVAGGGVYLFKTGPVPITPNSLLGDFTVPTFGGYTPVTAPTLVAINLPSGDGIGMMGSILFTCDGTASDTVAGYFWGDGSDALVEAEYFDSPIPMVNNGDFIQIDIVIPIAFTVPVT